MFTIKRMLPNGYDAMTCSAYRVEYFGDGNYIHLFDEGGLANECKLLVHTVAYVENSNGKTVDRIYGKTSCSDAPAQPPANAEAA